ncbi:unnamed protein product [Haemonchus placei]|uniref:LITAF domain-containing protein n=1 Tax=Haemonchus placei TaxID=6290 RepID=A0A0N4X9Q3_HAEPC|nr:unnamed protein product [Haemonchus placei]
MRPASVVRVAFGRADGRSSPTGMRPMHPLYNAVRTTASHASHRMIHCPACQSLQAAIRLTVTLSRSCDYFARWRFFPFRHHFPPSSPS